jgi:hypothetical protein
LKLLKIGNAFLKKASSEILQPNEKAGKYPQRLPGANFEEPSLAELWQSANNGHLKE